MPFDPGKPKPTPGATPAPSQGDVVDIAANDALSKLDLGRGRIDLGAAIAGSGSSLTAPLNARYNPADQQGPGIDQQAMGVLGNALTWSVYSRERPLIGLDTALKNLTGHGFIDDLNNGWNSFADAGKNGNIAAAATTGAIGLSMDILTNKFSRGRLNSTLAQQLIDVKGKGLDDKLTAGEQSRFQYILNPETALQNLAKNPLSLLNLNPAAQLLDGTGIFNFLLENFSGGIKVSDVYDQARKRGFTDQDIADLQSGKKSIYDFGGIEYMVSDNAFVDFGLDIATDPMTYLTFGVGGVVKGAVKSAGVGLIKGASKKIAFRGVELGFGAFGKSATNGLRTAVARGAHAFSELKRVGLVRKVAPAADEAAEALLKGDVSAATAEGLGEATARVAIGAESGSRYVRTLRAAGRKVGRGVIAYDVFATGYTVLEGAAEYTSDNIFKPGERGGFVDALLDFTDETTKYVDENGNVQRNRWLSDKAAFIILSAQHYRPGQVINAMGYDFIKKQITADGTNAVKTLLKGDFEGPILDSLTKGVEGLTTRDAQREWVIKNLDNDEQAYWSLIELGISRVVAFGSRDGSYVGLNPNLRRALQVSAESADDIIVSGNRRWAAILREARRAMDAGDLKGSHVAEILSDWGRKTKNEVGQGRKTRVEGLEYDLSPEEFLANFKNYRKRANQLADIVGERVPVVLALYDDIPTQEIYIEVLDQLRIGGTKTKGKKYKNIFGEEVENVTIDKTQLREILLNRSSLMSGKNGQRIARFLEKDSVEELTLKEFEQLIQVDYDRAPTQADIMSALRMHERLAPEPLGASPIVQDVDGVVNTAQLRERPIEVTASRMRPEIQRGILGTADESITKVETVESTRMTTPEIAVFEETIGEFINLTDAAQVRTVERSIGRYEGALEPSVTITLAPTETVAGARRAAALALRGFSSNTRNWQDSILIVADAVNIARSNQAGVLDLAGKPIAPNAIRLVWKIKNIDKLPASKIQAIVESFDFPLTYNKATGEITAIFTDADLTGPIENAISGAESKILNLEGVKLDGRSSERVYAEFFSSGERAADNTIIRKSPELVAVESEFSRYGLGGVLDAASSTDGIVHLTTDASAAAAKRRAESRPARYSTSGTLESLESISTRLQDTTLDAAARTEAENALVEALHSSSMSDAQIATWLQTLEAKLKGGASAPLSSLSGEPSYSPLKLVKDLMDTGLSQDVAEATAQIVELRARAWSRQTGMPISEYYSQRIERIVAEESDPSVVAALWQSRQQALKEVFEDPDITPEQALKFAEEFDVPKEMQGINGPKLKPELVEIPGIVDGQGRPRRVVIPGGLAALEPVVSPAKITEVAVNDVAENTTLQGLVQDFIRSIRERTDFTGYKRVTASGRRIYSEGGCLIFSVALQKKYGGKLIGAWDDVDPVTSPSNLIDHVAVQLEDGTIIDSRGKRFTEDEFLDDLAEKQGWEDPAFDVINTDGTGLIQLDDVKLDIPYDEGLSNQIFDALNEAEPRVSASATPEYTPFSLGDEVIIRSQGIILGEAFEHQAKTGDAGPIVTIAKIYKKLWAGKEVDLKDPFLMMNKLFFSMLSPNTALFENEALYGLVRTRNLKELVELGDWARSEIEKIKSEFPDIDSETMASKMGVAYQIKLGRKLPESRLVDFSGEKLKEAQDSLQNGYFTDPTYPDPFTAASNRAIGRIMSIIAWASEDPSYLQWFALKDGESTIQLAQRYTGFSGVGLKVGNFAVELASPSKTTAGTIDEIMTRVIADWLDSKGMLDSTVERIREVEPKYADVIVEYRRKKLEAESSGDTKAAKEATAANASGQEVKIKSKRFVEEDAAVRGGIGDLPDALKGKDPKYVRFGGSYSIMNEILQMMKDEFAEKYDPIFKEMSLAEFQWFMWDSRRGQIEPHSIVANGAERMPKASVQELLNGLAALRSAGYKKVGQKVRPTDPNVIGKLWQERTGEILGSTTFADDGRAIIRIGKNADASTALHEFAHVWRRELTGEDLTFFGERYGVTDGVWTREAEEAFVADVEQYVKEGKHPDARVQNVMGKFKNWLREIYGYLKGEKKLSPEVRARLDKLFEGEDVQAPPMFRESSTLDVLSRLQKDFATSKGDARLVTTTASAERAALDAARIASFPMPQWHPSMRKSDAQWLNDVRAFEAELKTLDPDYTVSLPPDTYIPWRDGKMLTQTMKDYIQARSVIYDWIEKIGPLSKSAGALRWAFAGSNREQARVSKRFFYRQMIGLGATPKQVEMFLAAIHQRAESSSLWDKASVKLFRRGQDLLPSMITEIGKEVFGEKVTAKLKEQKLTYWQVMDRSSSGFYRWLDGKIKTGSKGEAAKLVAARYNAAQASVLQQWGVRFISRIAYPVLRFYSDPRWWMLNYLEADILTATQLGLSTAIKGRKLNKRARDGENISSPVTLTHETRQIPIGNEDAGKPIPELDTGWVDNRHLAGYVTAGMDEAASRNRERVLKEAGIDAETGDIINFQETIDWLEKNDPDFQWFNDINGEKITYASRMDQAKAIEARLKAIKSRDAGKPLTQILDEQMYKFDEKGVKKTVEDEAKLLFSPEEFIELQPVIQAIAAKNNDSYVSLKNILRGNPNRSNVEKILNSYWLFWPISYQLKAGKWFFKVMVDAEGGGTLKNLAKFEYIRAKFETNIQRNEQFRNVFEQNPTLWQIARMILPMDPSEYGVSLGRPTRYTGQMLGLIEQSAIPMDPLRAAVRSLSLGPLYLAELLQYMQREGSFERIPEEIRSLLPDFGSEQVNKEETP